MLSDEQIKKGEIVGLLIAIFAFEEIGKINCLKSNLILILFFEQGGEKPPCFFVKKFEISAFCNISACFSTEICICSDSFVTFELYIKREQYKKHI